MARALSWFEVDRCKGLRAVHDDLPQDVLHMARDRFQRARLPARQLIDPLGKCTGCALCALMCPDVCLNGVSIRIRNGHDGSRQFGDSKLPVSNYDL